MSSLSRMVILLLAMPLAGSLVTLIIGKKKLVLASLLPSISAFLTLVLSFLIAWQSTNTSQAAVGWEWFTIGKQAIALSFEFNRLTIPLMVIVATISFLVHIYSISFFKGDQSLPRYYSTLGLFTFSMLGLTLSGNLLQLFIFWELVGACSYLLIGYYRQKPEASAAATKSFIMNKIGDSGFLVALMILWSLGGLLEISSLETSSISIEIKTLISISILLAIFSKSAQFPFHTWLPDAMEGPTPVSALIHSATMVAAGVFLITRLHFLFTPATLQVAAIVGAITALIGGLNALKEKDIKRLLAWSTLSQLGLMIMVAGNAGFNASFVHLLSHAIFKAGLFLVAGILIATYSNYDVKNLSTQKKPAWLVITVSILCLSLMGLPLTIGFLSKEFMAAQVQSTIFLGIFFLVSLISILYSVRLLAVVIPFGKKIELEQIGKVSISGFLFLPVIILAIASVWIFYSPSPVSAQWISEQWNLKAPDNIHTIFGIVWVTGGLLFAYFMARNGEINRIGRFLPAIPFDHFLQKIFIRPVFFMADTSRRFDALVLDKGLHGIAYINFSIALFTRWFDENIIDGITDFIAYISKLIGNLLRQFVAGKIQSYIWWTVLAVIILFMIMR